MILGLEGVSHTWPSSGVRACADVSLALRPGSVHALVGENGCGKTTLGHILAGVRQPDSGRLIFNGREIDLSKNFRGAIPGIGLVRQKNIWPSTLKLWEAAIVGREKRFRPPRIYINHFRRIADEWQIGGLNPHGKIGELDGATLQRGQLTAALMHNPKILILDEPAAGWEEGRAEEFFTLLKRFKQSGMGVLLITHRLEDVFRAADDLTVMNHGRVAASGPIGAFDHAAVTTEMFRGDDERGAMEHSAPGGHPQSDEPQGKEQDRAAPLRCESVNLRIAGRQILRQVNFDVRAGEIFSITGLREEGLVHLENVVSGQILPTSGRVLLAGEAVRGGCAKMRRAGLGYVPSDTPMRGASLISTVAENMMVLEAKRLARRGWWLHPKAIRRWAERRRREGGILGHPDQRMEELSGGNIQKIILQREFEYAGDILLLADPTMGLDAKSRRQVQRRLRELANCGKAILLLTSDLSEALEDVDRMAVLSKGRLSPVRPVKDWDRHEAATRIAGLWKESG